MTLLLIQAKFAKSYVAAHTRTLANGKVIPVASFLSSQNKRAERDDKTGDLFGDPAKLAAKPPIAAAVSKGAAVAKEFESKHKALTEAKADGVQMKSRCRDARAWVSDELIAGHISETDYNKWIGMVDDIHNEKTVPKHTPLEGHPYHDKSDEELRGIVKDAGETARIQRGMSSEGKYLDQMNDASTVLYHRKQNGIVNPLESRWPATHSEGEQSAEDRLKAAKRNGAPASEISKLRHEVLAGMTIGPVSEKTPSAERRAMKPGEFDSLSAAHGEAYASGYAAEVRGYSSQPHTGIRSKKGKTDFLDGWMASRGEAAPKVLAKSIPVLFLKSHVKQFTRQDGTIVKEHDDKRTKKMAPVEPGSAHGYGPHNVEAGDSLKFKAGDFSGGGKVKSVGQDGVTVTDASGRDHGVHWHEVSGRGGKAGGGGGKESPVDDAKPVADAPEPPEKKEPAEAKEPAAEKPSNVVGIKDKKTGVDDFARALFDTSELAKLPGASQQPGHLDSWDTISKAAPQALEQFTEKLKQVSDALGLEQGRIPSSFDMAQEEENSKAKKEDRQPKTLSEEKYMSPALWNNPRGFLFIGPLKKHDRALAKVKADYTKDGVQDWTKLQDVVRATIAVPSITQIPKVLAEMAKAGIKLAKKPKNNLIGDGLHSSGYRDLNMIVEMPNGMMCELQIHCKPITEAKEHGHEYYAENAAIERKYPNGRGDIDQWSDEDKEKHGDNAKKMKSMYDAAWEKSLSGNDSGGNDLHKSLAGRKIILWKKGVGNEHKVF